MAVDAGGWADIRAVAHKANVTVCKIVEIARALYEENGHPVFEIAMLDPGHMRKTEKWEGGHLVEESYKPIDAVAPLLMDEYVFPQLARYRKGESMMQRMRRREEEGEENGAVERPVPENHVTVRMKKEVEE